MRPCLRGSLLLPLVLLLRVTSAIFADEAYQIDFHHALVGSPQEHTTFFHRPSAGSKGSLLYTLSNIGIVGAVNPKDGSVLWRQRLGSEGEEYKGRGVLKAGPGSDIVASAFMEKLQVWDAIDGRLGWEWQAAGSIKDVQLTQDQTDTFVVITGQQDGKQGFVKCFTGGTGQPQWQYEDNSGNVAYSLIVADARLFYVSLHAAILKGFKVKIIELDIRSGQQKGQPHLFSSESEIFSEDSIIFAGVVGNQPVIVWTDKTLKTIKLGSILQSQTTTLEIQAEDSNILETVKVHASSEAHSNSRFLLHLQSAKSHSANIFNIDTATGKATRSHTLPKIPGKGVFTTTSMGSELYFVRHTPSEITLTSSTKAEPLQSWRIQSRSGAKLTELRALSHVVAELASKSSSIFSVRSVLALESGDWEMVRNGKSSWVKMEGLTGVIAAAFADIAVGENLDQGLIAESQRNIFSAYMHRLIRHLQALLSLPVWLETQYWLLRSLFTNDKLLSEQMHARGDKFGFGQLIIVATKSGRVAALDTKKVGRVVWNIRAVSIEGRSVWRVQGIDIDADTALVRSSQGEAVRIELSTGRIVHHQESSPSFSVIDERAQQVSMAIKSSDDTGQIPSTTITESRTVITPGDGHKLAGWTILQDQKSTLVWEFRPFPGQRITQVAHRPIHDPVASIGKVLGDRSVLYKYLNPNVVLVLCKNEEESSITLFLLDSSSGDMLHSMSHLDVDLHHPISSAISENFFAYSFRSKSSAKESPKPESQEFTGYQLSISELFESPFANDRGPLDAASNSSSRPAPFAGGNGIASSPHVVSQTYLVPEPISKLSFTSTLQGITPRSLLCVNPRSSSIVSIPRYILDPRRPVGRDPTSVEMEEGLFQYNAVLEFDPKWYLNHKRESLGFSNVISSPSLLESTSLVFAFGEVDLFGTRVSPIGGFDVLGKGFSKFQLLATVAALAAGTGILAPLVSSEILRVSLSVD